MKNFEVEKQSVDTGNARKDLPVATVQQTVKQTKKVKLTFLLDDDVRARWKKAAVDKEMTVTDMLIEAMNKTYNV